MLQQIEQSILPSHSRQGVGGLLTGRRRLLHNTSKKKLPIPVGAVQEGCDPIARGNDREPSNDT